MNARIDLMHVTPDVASVGQISSTRQDTTTADLPTVERDTIAKVLQECRRLSRTQLYVRLRKDDLERPPAAHERMPSTEGKAQFSTTAVGLMIVMVGAMVLHSTRGATSSAIITALLFVLLTCVAYLRWNVRPIAPRVERRVRP
jgi:hypothetical protein